jgi:hypothetical protein
LMQRVDTSAFYLLVSDASAGLNATFNALRPFFINMGTGLVSSQNGQDFRGGTAIENTLTVAGAGVGTGLINIQRGGLSPSQIFDDGNFHIKTPTAMWFDAPGFYWGPAAGGGGYMQLGLDSGIPKLTLPGNMLINPASGNATISLLKAGGNTTSISTDGNTIFVTAPVTASRGATHYFQSENGAVTFGTWTSTVLTVNGDITATSDRRLKKHIAYKVDFGLAEVLALKPVTYRWKKAEGRERTDKEIGLIAQDVEEIFPEFVHTDDETGIKSVDYQKLSVACIAAIKELAARLDKLEARA